MRHATEIVREADCGIAHLVGVGAAQLELRSAEARLPGKHRVARTDAASGAGALYLGARHVRKTHAVGDDSRENFLTCEWPGDEVTGIVRTDLGRPIPARLTDAPRHRRMPAATYFGVQLVVGAAPGASLFTSVVFGCRAD